MPKADKTARVTVSVHVEGVLAIQGVAALPGVPKEAPLDEAALLGMLKSPALRAVTSGGLRNADEIRERLHVIHRVNLENRLAAEQAAREESGETTKLEA